MRTALTNGRIFTPHGIRADCAVLLNDERIEALVFPDDVRCRDARVEDLSGLAASTWVLVRVDPVSPHRVGTGDGRDRPFGMFVPAGVVVPLCLAPHL